MLWEYQELLKYSFIIYKINSTISPGPRAYDTKEDAESVVGDKSYYISTIKIEWEE